jgi:NTP pyrophosphatase (non-canonical NTP hydrolase)
VTVLNTITDELVKFRDERDWAQFHNTKDLAIALNIESSELLELFLWKSAEDADTDKIKEELADILAYALLLANKLGLDPIQIVQEKIKANALKYPIEKSKGISTKYCDLK